MRFFDYNCYFCGRKKIKTAFLSFFLVLVNEEILDLADKPYCNHNDGYHKDDMDKPLCHMKDSEPKKPKYYEHNSDNQKHVIGVSDKNIYRT
jgi:hypothetical protein